MYLVAIHVPVFRDDQDQILVSTEWARSLILLRDSLKGTFGDISVVAPECKIRGETEQQLTAVKDMGPGFEFQGVFDGYCSARDYWLHERKKWIAAVRKKASVATVVHTGMNDLYRPINLDAFRVAVASKALVVFVRDTDEIQKASDLARNQRLRKKLLTRIYNPVYERIMRWAVSRADLSFLKGQALMKRYAGYANNPHTFHDTSYSSSDVISSELLEQRLSALSGRQSIRLVYCGRLEYRKGVEHSVRAIAHAREIGAEVSLDIIGDGEERQKLERLVKETCEEHVRFLGKKEYGSALLEFLRSYDALLFTPLGEDTPRMIFDAYAAGLPLLGYEIAYTRERLEEEQAARLSPLGDWQKLGEMLRDLGDRPQTLVDLSRNARKAGLHHSAEYWYEQRAELTFAMAREAGRLP